MRAWEIDTAAKRARLAPRKNPYWRGIAGGRGGVSLGYRRAAAGAGAWIAKMVVEGRRVEERIGFADDAGCASTAIGYRAAVAIALEWSVRQYAALEAAGAAEPKRRPTVKTAVEAYIKVRQARSERHGKIAQGSLTKHVLSDVAFANTPLWKLRATHFEEWRGRLPMRPQGLVPLLGKRDPKNLAPTTVDRLLTDLRAALNAAGVKHRRELPASFALEVKLGTKALGMSTEARRQILTDEQLRAAIEAAFDVDESGDFGRLVLLAASTGARFSQITGKALTVAGFQVQRNRVMVPSSRKGRSKQAKPPVAVPLSDDTVLRLLPAIQGRDPSEPLLMRWQHRIVAPRTWARDFRREWRTADETTRLWNKTALHARLPAGTSMYCLRHTSIVRALRAMLPVRLVAALHDTSVKMIEQHYSAYIVDATEDLARRAVLSMAPDAAPVRVAA